MNYYQLRESIRDFKEGRNKKKAAVDAVKANFKALADMPEKPQDFSFSQLYDDLRKNPELIEIIIDDFYRIYCSEFAAPTAWLNQYEIVRDRIKIQDKEKFLNSRHNTGVKIDAQARILLYAGRINNKIHNSHLNFNYQMEKDFAHLLNVINNLDNIAITAIDLKEFIDIFNDREDWIKPNLIQSLTLFLKILKSTERKKDAFVIQENIAMNIQSACKTAIVESKKNAKVRKIMKDIISFFSNLPDRPFMVNEFLESWVVSL